MVAWRRYRRSFGGERRVAAELRESSHTRSGKSGSVQPPACMAGVA